MIAWDAKEIRVTWITSAAQDVNADELFEAAFEEVANASVRNKALTPSSNFFSKATAEIAGRTCEALIGAGRVDLFLRPVGSQQPGGEISLLANGLSAMDLLLKAAVRGCQKVPSAQRLAVAPTFAALMNGNSDVSKTIFEMLRTPYIWPEVTDLAFTINRRKPLRDRPDVLMNRVMRYGSDVYQMLQFALSQNDAGPTVLPTAPNSPSLTFLTLGLDVNLPVLPSPLSAEEQQILLAELGDEAARIARDGSITALES